MNADLSQELLTQLSELCKLRADMRFGQMLATLGELAEDEPGRSLWDIEDAELVGVLERFRQDLSRRGQSIA